MHQLLTAVCRVGKSMKYRLRLYYGHEHIAWTMKVCKNYTKQVVQFQELVCILNFFINWTKEIIQIICQGTKMGHAVLKFPFHNSGMNIFWSDSEQKLKNPESPTAKWTRQLRCLSTPFCIQGWTNRASCQRK